MLKRTIRPTALPAVTVSRFDRALTLLREYWATTGHLPPRFDKDFLSTHFDERSSFPIVGGFKRLGWVDYNTNEPTPTLERLVQEEHFADTLRQVLVEQYGDDVVHALSKPEITREWLGQMLEDKFKMHGAIRTKGTALLIHLAQLAGIAVAPQLIYPAHTRLHIVAGRQEKSVVAEPLDEEEESHSDNGVSASSNGHTPSVTVEGTMVQATQPRFGAPERPDKPTDASVLFEQVADLLKPHDGNWSRVRREGWLKVLQVISEYLDTLSEEANK